MLATALVAAVAAPSAPASTRDRAVALTSLERGVLADINAFRAANHLGPLRVSASLTEAARRHSQQMEADGYFAHSSFDGTAFWKRIKAFYPSGGYGFWSVGENLVWEEPDLDAGEALRLWMASPPHRHNILDPQWREIGVSALHVTGAPSVFGGEDVTVITTDFGARL